MRICFAALILTAISGPLEAQWDFQTPGIPRLPNGRPNLAAAAPRTADGYSVGRWEGDTLVVETTGFRDGIWLDRKGNPMTEATKITERFRRVNVGSLDVEVTVDDPKAYTKPWTVKLRQILVPDSDLLEYYCQENEKDAPHLVGK